ncbi:EF-hand domain-containing protein [Lacinutrix algicola]|uniref:EF-hand domain-containing protein n=1 Tax=Lacinutrix algicola TaxID=342954 RepID=UPI0006E33137|nr:EF-hand domain-containing protein [Lacinutrix algicola]
MKYLKTTLAVAALFTFSQTYAQDIDVKVEKRFNKTDANNDKSINLEELTAFYEGKKNKKGEAFDAAKILKRKDTNEDGALSLEEFAAKGKKKGKKKK